MTTNAPQLIIRLAGPDDISFIYSTWLKSYRSGSGLGLASGKHTYFITYNLIIDAILQKPDCLVWIAADENDPEVIFGYAVCEPTIVHYVFVKDAFRRFGVAKTILKGAFASIRPFITHQTKISREILKTHTEFEFKPSLLLQGDSNGNSS